MVKVDGYHQVDDGGIVLSFSSPGIDVVFMNWRRVISVEADTFLDAEIDLKDE